MKDKIEPNTNFTITIFLSCILFFLLGMIIPISIIDDLEEFKIPGTEKVFIRKY